ncbi:MAG: PAS domain S-box protein [Candidatus Sulfobium sp.]|jgi:PAS domain S-box-containing protein
MDSAEKKKEPTRQQLIRELEQLREKVASLEQAEKQRLEEKEEDAETISLHRSILDNIACGVWVTDAHDVIRYANRGMEMIAGVTKQRLWGANVLEDLPESTIKHFKEHYLEARKSLRPVYYDEVPVITPAGKLTYQSGWLIPKVRDNRLEGMICTVEDITKQRHTRRALHKTEEKYRELVENANVVILRMDKEGSVTFFNEFAQKFFGFSEEEIVGRNVVGSIVPDTPKYSRGVKAMLRNIGQHPSRYASIEYKNVRKDGQRVWMSWKNRAVPGEDGEVSEVLCVGTDISERKRHEGLLRKCRSHLESQVRARTAQLTKANEELHDEVLERKWTEGVLRTSEEKYRLVVENASEGILIIQDGFFRFLNPKAVKIMGRPYQELTSKSFIEFIHPDDRDIVMENHLRKLKGDSLPLVYSCRILDAGGNTKWVEANPVLITWMGRPATLTFFSNITERKRAEERLMLLESAIQQTNDAIVITSASPSTPSSRIVFVNTAYTEMTGYTAEEVMGKPAIHLQSPETDGMEWLKLEGSGSHGDVFCIETVNRRKDGTRYDVEWHVAPIRNEHGKVTHFISTQRDITERRRAEEKVRVYQEQLRSLASELSLAEEHERRRLATDLHDHIGQTLAITRMKFGELRRSLADGDRAALLDEIWSLMQKTMKYTKSLTFELSPPILYELGLAATIEWLAEEVQKQHGISVDFFDDGLLKPLDREVSILMFQAVREIFMNVVKHAGAEHMKIQLARKYNQMQITVQDDGTGFDLDRIDKHSFGFFSIRERMKYFTGDFVVKTRPGQGTCVILTAPLSGKAEAVTA